MYQKKTCQAKKELLLLCLKEDSWEEDYIIALDYQDWLVDLWMFYQKEDKEESIEAKNKKMIQHTKKRLAGWNVITKFAKL